MLDSKPTNTPIVENHHLGEYPDQNPLMESKYDSQNYALPK